jgi:hypothetical protein
LTKRYLRRADVCFMAETVHWDCGDQLPHSLQIHPWFAKREMKATNPKCAPVNQQLGLRSA